MSWELLVVVGGVRMMRVGYYVGRRGGTLNPAHFRSFAFKVGYYAGRAYRWFE